MNVGPFCLKAMKSPGLHSLSITAGSPGKSRIEIIKGFEHVRGLKGHESLGYAFMALQAADMLKHSHFDKPQTRLFPKVDGESVNHGG